MSQAASTLVRADYAPVNGLNLYYEVHGSGQPLILLHGGVGGINMFGPNVQALAQGRQVIAVELQGHGRTADIDRPLRFETMGDDIAALVKHLGHQQTDLMGYSLGGGAALQATIRHPEVVRKLVVVSATAKRQGWYPEVLAGMAQMTPASAEMMKQSPLSQLYPNVNWPQLFGKLNELLGREYDWSKDVSAINAPTLLVFADADAVKGEHVMEFFGLLGGGKRDAGLDGSLRPVAQLAVLPGLTHYDIGQAPALASAVIPFLEAPVPLPV
jgi:pimeloyl-ACP methyl ester carboxylesterase